MPVFDPTIFSPTGLFDIGPVAPGMRVLVCGIDVTGWVDRDRIQPGDMALGERVGTIMLPLVDVDATLPVDPKLGCEVEFYDRSTVLIFGGYVGRPVRRPLTGARRWDLACHDWAIRLEETATGSLNKSAEIKSDREFLIAILRDALKGQTFGAATGLDDPIITANEAAGWPHVQGTAVISGGDWSYMKCSSAIDSLMRRVPDVHLRVRPDKLVEYGLAHDRAAIAFVSYPSSVAQAGNTALIEYIEGSYFEEELVGAHVNKMRRGGFGAAEVTALDEVSFGRFGRIIESPYRNDELVPAADLERLTYAELRAAAIQRQVRLEVADAPMVSPGQLVSVVCDKEGAFESDGPYPDMYSWDAPAPTREPVDAYRGEFIVQRVSRQMLGADRFIYSVELGSYVPDFVSGIADQVGA